MSHIKNNQIKKPLLFIHQPKFHQSQVPMQKSFSIKKTNKPVVHEPETKIENEVIETPIHEHQVPKDRGTKTKELPVPEKKKRFAELNVEERILFFLNNLPNNVPKPMCEFITNEEKHKGFIVSYEEGLVSIRKLTNPSKLTLKLNDITAINIIGF